ncbi:MAG TPA: glycosyltransferase family 39 protein [Roseiflexaceae bacterium]
MADKKAISLQPGAGARATPRLQIGLCALASYLLVGMAALVPRVLVLGLFITDDEANFWLARSNLFLNALLSRNFVATAITDHPGVTTMWLGAAGIVLRRALAGWGLLHFDTFQAVLAAMRLPAALAHVAAILLGYALLRRMLPALVALLAALLWALDPFVVGYSRLLHTDALACSFATLSLLAACYFWNHAARRRWLVVSGICAGLAFLSKSPALVLLPAVGLVALLAASERSNVGTLERWNVGRRLSPLLPLLAWGAIAATTVFALWPALWVSPIKAYEQIRIGVAIEGAQPHMLGNFFLGRADDAPGLLYYPVALPLRLTPWTLLGLLALPLTWRVGWSADQRRDFAALAGFATLFVVAMDLFPKKFDRYVVPAFPALDILAAAGLVGILGFGFWIFDFERNLSKIQNPKSKISLTWVGIIAVAALANMAWWHPYSIVAFNQLFGGTRAGARTFVVGWGEGLDQVADWLNAQPDITGVKTVVLRPTSLNPYLKDGAQANFPRGDQLRDHTGYVVVYLPDVQTGATGPPFDRFYGRAEPLHVVRIHGVDFAWVYRAPPQVARPRPAGFGPAIRLVGFDPSGPWARGQRQRLRLTWETTAIPPADYWLFAHLDGPDGRRYAQLDLPYPTSQWAPGRTITSELPITLPADAPAGAYRLLIGLYLPEQGQRLALASDDPGAVVASDPGALVLDTFELK